MTARLRDCLWHALLRRFARRCAIWTTYLKGSDFLAAVDGSELRKKNSAKNEKTSDVTCIDNELLEEAGVNERVLAEVDLSHRASRVVSLVRLLPYNKHYLPDFVLDNKLAYVVKNGITTIEGDTSRKRELVCLDSTRTHVSIRKMDKNRFKAIRKRESELMKRYHKTGKHVRESYKRAFPYLTSREFWEKYLGMRN